jgi:hypothetical protein
MKNLPGKMSWMLVKWAWARIWEPYKVVAFVTWTVLYSLAICGWIMTKGPPQTLPDWIWTSLAPFFMVLSICVVKSKPRYDVYTSYLAECLWKIEDFLFVRLHRLMIMEEIYDASNILYDEVATAVEKQMPKAGRRIREIYSSNDSVDSLEQRWKRIHAIVKGVIAGGKLNEKTNET